MQDRLQLFPLETTIEPGDKGKPSLHIGGIDLESLADEFGTPLYLFDEVTLDDAVAQYRRALQAYYPAESGITLAGKALLLTASAQWAHTRGLWLDCTGAGEIAIARRADVPAESILVHGVNKSDADLDAALRHSSTSGAGVIVVDNLTELARIFAHSSLKSSGTTPAIWLRVRPGIAVDTHAYRQTGQADSKFGMEGEEVETALQMARAADVEIEGIHFHQGSHFHDVSPIAPGLDAVLDLIANLQHVHGWTPRHLSPGGGWGVPYHEEDLPHPTIEEYVRFVAGHLVDGCHARNLPLPTLHVEPGRSLVAKAGVAIYRVGASKQSAARRWLLIDGGMADNPRPALYGARYSALPVREPLRPARGVASFGGPFCESGDVLIHDLPMAHVADGEYVAVPVSGAYHVNMQSNYNGARKPTVLWLRAGKAHVVQRRETVDDLLARDVSLSFE